MIDKKIGIFGGGQLAKMIAIEGSYMGLHFNIFDPNPFACGKSFGQNFFNKEFLDQQAIDDFFNCSHIVTYEFENVMSDFFLPYTEKIPQGIKALQLLQDRYTEKNFINSLKGVKTVNFQLANEDIKIPKPYIIKSRRNGYDGKGQQLINKDEEVDSRFLNENYIIEEFLQGTSFREYSIIMGRSTNGEFANYQPFANEHKNGILHISTIEKIQDNIKQLMIDKTKEIITSLNYYGVLCVEFFVIDNKVYVNEVAPRVHNSGHLTIEGANISQFKLHILCILGLPLPTIVTYSNYYMVNLLGQHIKPLKKIINNKEYKDVNFHMYGKNSTINNRKVGHLTFQDTNNLLNKIKGVIK